MLRGQRIKVYTNHKNLVRDVLGLIFDHAYRWQLLLEEYGPKRVYINRDPAIDIYMRLNLYNTVV